MDMTIVKRKLSDMKARVRVRFYDENDRSGFGRSAVWREAKPRICQAWISSAKWNFPYEGKQEGLYVEGNTDA